MKLKLTLITFVLVLMTTPFLLARHIVGGEMTYRCLSSGAYEFTLKLYRDCGSQGAFFDDPATIVVYQGTEAPFTNTIHQLPLTNIMTMPTLFTECPDQLPLMICTEVGEYVFTLDLPVVDEPYHIVYQRCCRNNILNNIVESAETGVSIMMTLSLEAQMQCNESPRFDDTNVFPLCVGEPFSIDLSATELEGDSLVYELCTPLIGGGLVGTPEVPGDPNACNGVMPTTVCPPPYDMVAFVAPLYSESQPLGTADFMLNKETGELTGTPSLLGAFLFGVCISEYRDGELLSMTQRELQIITDFESPTATHDLSSLSLDLFPNPATNQTSITLPNAMKAFQLIIRDINGRIVRQETQISGETHTIDLADLQGIYLVELIDSEARYMEKLLVW